MNGSDRKLVVMTPVRNEAWILPRFLDVTGRVADLIIILDQFSTDGSVELCKAHPKVAFVENRSAKYNEAERQKILIEMARRLVPGPRVLLALDADEIIAADSPGSSDWQRGMNAPPGTVWQIEKPTFFGDVDNAIRYPGGFPLGVVDDDSPHNPSPIHSVRVPMRPDSPTLRLDQVKALHYALLRPKASRAKHRMYAALENVGATRNLMGRRHMYSSGKDYSAEGPVEKCPQEWFLRWERLGIEMRTVLDESPHWQDFELLRLMAVHGPRKFWLDDIWDADWEAIRQEGLSRGVPGLPDKAVNAAPAAARWSMVLPDMAYSVLRAFRSKKAAIRNNAPPVDPAPVKVGSLTNAADNCGIMNAE